VIVIMSCMVINIFQTLTRYLLYINIFVKINVYKIYGTFFEKYGTLQDNT